MGLRTLFPYENLPIALIEILETRAVRFGLIPAAMMLLSRFELRISRTSLRTANNVRSWSVLDSTGILADMVLSMLTPYSTGMLGRT